MRSFIIALRVLAGAFLGTASLHLVLGQRADELLGSPVTADMKNDPSFDSQNRFYGVTFGMLGVVLLIGSTSVSRYRPMISATLGVLFVAGLGRILAWGLHGKPARPIVVIVLADLVLPPVFWLWMRRLPALSSRHSQTVETV